VNGSLSETKGISRRRDAGKTIDSGWLAHGQGLEIVALSFEESDQLAHPTRLRPFIQHYEIEYPVLVPGIPGQLREKLPQPVNMNSWPTMFFVGRDARVHAIHAGFPGAASGASSPASCRRNHIASRGPPRRVRRKIGLPACSRCAKRRRGMVFVADWTYN
jgi:hypothetical protein